MVLWSMHSARLRDGDLGFEEVAIYDLNHTAAFRTTFWVVLTVSSKNMVIMMAD